MERIFSYIIIAIFFVIILKSTVSLIYKRIKKTQFMKKHFSVDKLYSIDDLSSAFNLDSEKMLEILNTIEKSGSFHKLKKNEITMNKNYFSKYEINILVGIIIKKQKL